MHTRSRGIQLRSEKPDLRVLLYSAMSRQPLPINGWANLFCAWYARAGQSLPFHTLSALNGADYKTEEESTANHGQSKITSAFVSPVLAHAAPLPFQQQQPIQD